jgi:hypothetical protein
MLLYNEITKNGTKESKSKLKESYFSLFIPLFLNRK